ncbi:hypothetical protein BC833DRAFT_570479 [Globomyces pollinis-pini]|nr:hypothetical protein BC833DRAFT_570479 [Globomyces pollinis-pini]
MDYFMWFFSSFYVFLKWATTQTIYTTTSQAIQEELERNILSNYTLVLKLVKMTDLTEADSTLKVIEVLPMKHLQFIQNHLKIGKLGIMRINNVKQTGKETLLRFLDFNMASFQSGTIEALKLIPLCYNYFPLTDVSVLGFKTQIQHFNKSHHLTSTNIYLMNDFKNLVSTSSVFLYFAPACISLPLSQSHPRALNCMFPPNAVLKILRHDFTISIQITDQHSPLKIPITAFTNLEPLTSDTFTLEWPSPLSRTLYPSGFTIAILQKTVNFEVTLQSVQDNPNSDPLLEMTDHIEKFVEADIESPKISNGQAVEEQETLVTPNIQPFQLEMKQDQPEEIDLDDVVPDVDVYEIMEIQRLELEFYCNPHYKDLGAIRLYENMYGKQMTTKNITAKLSRFSESRVRSDLEFDLSNRQYDFLMNNRKKYKVVFTMGKHDPNKNSIHQHIALPTLVMLNREEVIRAYEDNFGDGYGIDESIVDIFHFLQPGGNHLKIFMDQCAKNLDEKYVISIRVLEYQDSPTLLDTYRRQRKRDITPSNYVENKPIYKYTMDELRIVKKIKIQKPGYAGKSETKRAFHARMRYDRKHWGVPSNLSYKEQLNMINLKQAEEKEKSLYASNYIDVVEGPMGKKRKTARIRELNISQQVANIGGAPVDWDNDAMGDTVDNLEHFRMVCVVMITLLLRGLLLVERRQTIMTQWNAKVPLP